MFSYQDTKMQ
ncbi:ribosomal protein L7A, partial [Danaus plexippus plexippus]